ncbi:uncharacterized protein LOC125943413 [Dermacentor silvarum]|uniref:uncharacterized protein LOC125943413 n=1 Tax=Dermacentor silvarum TaxID=543639 RepID=UPI002100FFEE|nr:uncharacterized protein LOC125943413 [Dermacentor silvarum]
MLPRSRLTWVIIVASFAYATASNYPELKPFLWEHQNCWKTLIQDRPFVLYQRSFEHDPSFSWDGDCIQGFMFEFYPEERYAVGIVQWRASENKRVNRTVYLFAETTEGYKWPNAYVSSSISD